MAEDEALREEHAAEVRQRNLTQARELLASKQRQEQERGAEPPLEDDPHPEEPGQNPLAQEATGVRGSTGGIRNMGGGRA